jgi:hypothetical protein
MRWRALAGVVALAASVRMAPGQEPHAPKLGADVAPTAAVADLTPAGALPAQVTICVDRTGRQCWSVGGASDCRSPSAGGEVFATIASESPDAGARLRACWDSLAR